MAYLDQGLFNWFASIDGHFSERAGEPAGRIVFLVQKVSVLNVSCRHTGMQARLKDAHPLAVYIPCSAHSLNLVGVSAVDCCVEAISFFGFVQQLYNFFSASIHRWTILTEQLDSNRLTVKSLSETRWSARADAVKGLCTGYNCSKSSLSKIASDSNQNGTTKHDAT